MPRKTLILLFSLLLTVAGWAQDFTSSNKKAIRALERGQSSLEQGDMSQAAQWARQAIDEDKDFVEAHLFLAEILNDMGQEGESIDHYRSATSLNPTFFTRAWLTLANLELKRGEYEQAIDDFEVFLKYEKKGSPRRDEASRGIATAQFRQRATANPVPFNPMNMGNAINSCDDEYLPALTADGQTLVFTRRMPRRTTTTADTKEEDIYCSTFENGAWGKAQRMPEPLNSTDNEGAECISQDGRIMFFTACNRKDGGGRCDLYMCINKGDGWGKPRNLGPEVNSGAWEGQPSFSIDGKTLYFVSNRKGGYGGMDIWKTVFESGHWSEPVNLGPRVNTAGNESSPFIHYDDRTLYFASDGHMGMGGLDIFVTHRADDGNWQEVRNLGYPINTLGDESNLIVSADGHTAIYSSDRDGGLGKLDLWSFTIPEESRPAAVTCFKGTVTDAANGSPVSADIKVVGLKDGMVVANTSSDSHNGNYIVSIPSGEDYAFLVSAKGYLFYSQNKPWEEASSDLWSPVTVDIALQPITSGSTMALRNVFFETGRWEILPQSEYELLKVVELLQQNPTLKIELGGHTDNVGQPKDNQRLSEQRAKAVVDYLVGKGISASRLTHKGYGESSPVAPNDTPEGRALNRRTEVKIL